MKAEDFEPYKGKEIKVDTEDGRKVDLKLEKIERMDPQGVEDAGENIRSEPFTLIFSGSVKQRIMDQLVDVPIKEYDEPPKIFLKPLREDGERMIYEAVIN